MIRWTNSGKRQSLCHGQYIDVALSGDILGQLLDRPLNYLIEVTTRCDTNSVSHSQ